MESYPFTTTAYIKKGVLLFISLIIVALIGFIGYYFLTYEETASFSAEQLQANFGLAATDSEAAIPGGYLYLLGTEESSQLARWQAYSLTDPSLIQDLPMKPSLAELADPDRQFGLTLLASETPMEGGDAIHPGFINYQTNETGLFGSFPLYSEMTPVVAPPATPNRQWIAYSGRVQPNAGASYTNINTWQIVLHNAVTDDTRVVVDAIHPAWINGENAILYLTSDGIYRYTLDTLDIVPIDDTWNNLTTKAGLAVASDSNAAILTVPELDTIVVYDLSDSQAPTTAGRITTPGVTYTNPVFSPSGTHYAVLATTDDVSQIEIRSVFDRTVATTITLANNPFTPPVLADWRLALEPIEWR